MNVKKILCGLLSAALLLSMAACGSNGKTEAATTAVPTAAPTTLTASQTETQSEKTPKYVFLFIGDGMSYPQFQAAADYLGAVADDDYEQALPSNSYDERDGAKLDGAVNLNFMDFDVAGSAITYDSCSFAPDSASTAT